MAYTAPDVGSVLTAPTRETGELELPGNLEAIDDCIGAINDFYAKVADIWPGGLPDFEISTVNELIQEHFSGDFQAIAANGDACVATGNGLGEIASTITAEAAELLLHWQGAASANFVARLGLFAAATEAAGLIVQQGERIFDIASTACREIGETVARVIGILVDIAVDLAEKIAKKLNLVTGILSTIGDAFSGFDDIKEIYDNACRLWDGIQWLLDAKENAYEFFDMIGTSFEIFEQLKELVASIPDLKGGGLQGTVDFSKRATSVMDDIGELTEQLEEEFDADADEGESQSDGLTSGAPT